MVDHQQVVGDEQIGDSELLLEFFEHVDDLCLDGNVQCGNRLIADDEGRVDRQSAGNADPLSLSAGELVGIPGGVLRVQADQFHEVQDLFMAVFLVLVEVVDVEGLTDNVFDRHTGVQGRVGVLEDHLHLLAEGSDVLAGDFLTLELERTPGGLIQVQERPSDGRLAAAGLTDEAQGLTGFDVEGDTVDGLQRGRLEEPGLHGEVHLEVLDFYQVFIICHVTRPPFRVLSRIRSSDSSSRRRSGRPAS